MDISLQKDDDLSVITLKGRGDYQDREKLRDYLNLLLANDALLLVVDLSVADFVSASLLGILTQKADQFVERGGRIMFVINPERRFSPLVSVDHLKKFFATALSVEEASRSIRAEVVEKESVRALIRRAKPTPPPLHEGGDDPFADSKPRGTGRSTSDR
ncbi:MAG: hypothetical protein U0166_18580 [Acidobacteriota bacterium]